MCGIVGAIGPVPPHVVRHMNLSQTHRGPDDSGYFKDSRYDVQLAMTRLAILDSPGGHQPMTSEDGGVTVVFNGEIFNAGELRVNLERRGVRFRSSHSDTEVLLNLYIHFGHEMLTLIKGMFAFIFFDKRIGEVFGAVDHSGIKPLYWAKAGRCHYFSSELKAIVAVDNVSRDIDFQALSDYLSFQFVSAPATILRDVRKLPPGSQFRLSLETGEFELEKYWSPSYSSTSVDDAGALAGDVRRVLSNAVERWLLSDREVGFSLSGGIDSSILVALGAQVSGRQVKTFSLGFSDSPEIDETDLARLVSLRWGTEHHEIILSDEELLSHIGDMVYSLDEPYGGGLPSWFVYKLMSERDVSVAITGTGGDELFGNYGKWLPFESNLAAARKLMVEFHRGASPADLVKFPVALRYHMYFRDSEKKQFLHPEIRGMTTPSEVAIEEALSASRNLSLRDSFARLDFERQLPSEFLHAADRFSMAHSIEARTPFLDQDFVDLILGIPSTHRTNGHSLKKLLIDSSSDLLPLEVLNRPKRGFVLPQTKWLRGALRVDAERLLGEEYLSKQGFFSPKIWSRLARPLLDGKTSYSGKLWTLLMFQYWYEYVYTGGQ